MTESSPGERAAEDVRSSLVATAHSGLGSDVEEATDSSNESALLADDPLEDGQEPLSVI